MNPRFISVEGTEGVGKTSVTLRLCDFLTQRGVPFLCTREPGGSWLGESLRTLLLDEASVIGSDAEILLMFAARSDHLTQVILPALADGKWVICDRFTDSTMAYQGFGRYHGDERVCQKIALLIETFVPKMPDVTLWLDLDPKIGSQRAAARSQADRFERLDQAFFGRVYQGYQTLYQQEPSRIRRIDASTSLEQVFAQVQRMLEPLLV